MPIDIIYHSPLLQGCPEILDWDAVCWDTIFRKYDSNGDGNIDGTELTCLVGDLLNLRAAGNASTSFEDAEKTARRIDCCASCRTGVGTPMAKAQLIAAVKCGAFSDDEMFRDAAVPGMLWSLAFVDWLAQYIFDDLISSQVSRLVQGRHRHSSRIRLRGAHGTMIHLA